ncbi:carboxypeptidase-like regulatory domain-containing protein [Sunxiuqinia sp. A32]|uniref:carboxypeptidase-like regulatory domain-containing protein n=1 Tax=Sunxiuqinia sp. A32 TaxID=3461496 RepID=UPI0040459545
MNRKQENRFSMFLSVVDYCEKDTTVTSSLPAFSSNFDLLKTTCTQIHAVSEKQATDITGTTLSKIEIRDQLSQLAADSSRKLSAYAKLTKNTKLLKEISFSEWELKQLPDTILADTCQLIYDRAQSNLASLSEYQISEETQTALQQAIDAYKLIMAQPRVEQVSKTQATRELSELFAEGNEAIGNMDAVVEIIRLSEAIFYAGYRSARKIIDYGAGKLSLRAKVLNSQTGEPIPGVTVTFWKDGNLSKAEASEEVASVIKQTAEKGGFNIKDMDTGTYLAHLQKEGYNEQSLTVYVNEGELTTMNVSLTKL